ADPLQRRKAGPADRRLPAEGQPAAEDRRRPVTCWRPGRATGVHGLRWAPRSSKPLVGILGDVDGRIVPVAPPPVSELEADNTEYTKYAYQAMTCSRRIRI